MIELGVIIALGLLAVPIVARIDRGMGPERLIGESILLGLGLGSLSLYALSLLGVRWRISIAMSIVLICAIATVWRGRLPLPNRYASATPRRPLAPRVASHACDALTALLFVGYALHATLTAPVQWDYWAIWGLKAKVFWFHGGIDWAFLLDPWTSFAHPDYPLLLPLLYDFLELARGAWDDRWLGVVFPLLAAATVLVVRGLVREETGSALLASLVGLAVTGTLLSRWVGRADPLLIALATTGVLLVRRGLNTDDPAPFRMGAVFIGLASLTKNEGLALLVAVSAALLAQPRGRNRLRDLWPAFALTTSWQLVRLPMGLSTDLFTGSVLSRVSQHLGEAGRVWKFFQSAGVEKPLFWLALMVILMGGIRFVIRSERFLATTVVLQFAFYVASFLTTPFDIVWHLSTAWTRTIEHLLPLLVVLSCYVLINWLGDPGKAQPDPAVTSLGNIDTTA